MGRARIRENFWKVASRRKQRRAWAAGARKCRPMSATVRAKRDDFWLGYEMNYYFGRRSPEIDHIIDQMAQEMCAAVDKDIMNTMVFGNAVTRLDQSMERIVRQNIGDIQSPGNHGQRVRRLRPERAVVISPGDVVSGA